MEVQLEPWSFAKIHIPCLFYSSKVGVRTCWKSEKSGYPKFRRLSIWVCLKMSCTPKANGEWSLSLLNVYNWEYTLFSDKPISFQCKVIDLFPNQALSVRLSGLRERSAGMQPPAAPGHYEPAPGGPRMSLADLKGHCNMEETKKETSRSKLY